MKIRILLIVIAFALMGLSAEAQLKFQKCVGTATGNEWAHCIQNTADGGFIVAGTTSYNSSFDQVYLVKLNSTADTIWTKIYSGTSLDLANSVIQTSDGGYMIVGHTLSFGAGNKDMLVIKTNDVGDTLWCKTIGTTDVDVATSVKQTTDGGYIITGNTYSSATTFYGAALIKLDATGTVLWNKIFSGVGSYNGEDVLQTNDGGYLVVGEAFSNISGINVGIFKTNNAGDTLWTKVYGGVGDEYVYSVTQTNDQGFIIVGQTNSYGAGATDVYVLKLDSMGVLEWTKTYGGTQDESGSTIQQTADGGYIICGSTASFGAGSWDVYLIKINASGIPAWSKTYGGTGLDYGMSLKITPDGGFIIAGFNSTFGAGARDFYIIKTDANGKSGCFQDTAVTVFANTGTSIFHNTTVVDSGLVSSPAPVTISSAGIATDLCNNVGIKELLEGTSISVSPNPFSTQTILTFQGSVHNPSLFIYNLLGQEVKSIPVGTNTQVTIQRNQLPAGMYFYKLIEEN